MYLYVFPVVFIHTFFPLSTSAECTVFYHLIVALLLLCISLLRVFFNAHQQVHFSAAVIYWLSSFAILLTLVNIRRCAWDIFPRKNGHQRKKVTFGADVDIELGPVSSRSTFNNDRQRLNDHGSGSKETTLTNRDTLPMSEAEMRLRERRAGALPPPWDCNHRCHRYGWQWLSEVFVGGAALCSIVTLALRWRAQGQPEGDERLHLGWQGLAQQVLVGGAHELYSFMREKQEVINTNCQHNRIFNNSGKSFILLFLLGDLTGGGGATAFVHSTSVGRSGSSLACWSSCSPYERTAPSAREKQTTFSCRRR